MACKVKSWLSHLSIKYPTGRSRNLTLVPQMVDTSAIPGNRTRKECADVHSFFLNTAESAVIKAEIALIEGAKDLVHGCRPLLLGLRHTRNEFAYQSEPRPCICFDLLKAAALIWAHAMRFQSSISFAYKKFHLALEMLLSNALWQPVTILPTYFIALHTRLPGDQGCELIGRFQHCRRRRKNGLLPLPVCKE